MKSIVIINPESGGGKTKNYESVIKSALSSIQPEIYKTSYPGHGYKIAQKAVARKAEMIIAVGGDGTVNEVINAIVNKDISLGIIPTGTANDLACLYNLPSDINKACEIILSGKTRKIDLISVNGRYYATSGGLGLSCDVVDIANGIKRFGTIGRTLGRILGSKLYILAVIAALFARTRHNNFINIRYGNCSFAINALSMLVDNQAFLGKNIIMSPGALNDDGLFDICLIENYISRFRILHLLIKTLNGSHTLLPYVNTLKARNVTINSQRPLCFFGDGEIIDKDTDFRVRLAPGALKLVVPGQETRSDHDR